MAIKELITLEGTEEVKKKIAEVAQTGEQAAAAINKTGQELGGATKPIQNFFVQVKGGQEAVRGFNAGLISIKDTLRVLRPAMSEVGAALGGLGAFAAASRAGILGLGAAISGAILTKLELVGDEARKATTQLGDLLKNRPQGETAFSQLNADAAKLGTTVDKLAPTVKSFFTALKEQSGAARFFAAPGQELPALLNPLNKAREAASALFEVMRFGASTLDESAKGAAEFSAALSQQGALTGEVMAKLRLFPAAYNALQTALGGAGKTQKEFEASLTATPKTIDQTTAAIGRMKTVIEPGFDPAKPQGLADAFDKLWNSVKRLAETEVKQDGGLGGLAGIITNLTPLVEKAGPSIIQFFNGISAELKSFSDIVGTSKTTWETFANLLANPISIKIDFSALDVLKRLFLGPEGSLLRRLLLGEIAPSPVGAAGGGKVPDILAPLQNIKQDVEKPPDLSQWKGEFDELGVAASADVEGIKTNLAEPPPDLSPWNAAFQGLLPMAQSIFDQIKALFAQPIQLNVQGGATGGLVEQSGFFASGGRVIGPGTSTSDSILARLSAGEFVQPTRRVQQYGMDFMESLRRGLVPVASVRSLMGDLRGFAGPIPRLPVPRFASGGPVGAGATGGNRSLTLVLDQKRFNVTGSKGTIDDLEREASLRGLAMIGKAPSWIR